MDRLTGLALWLADNAGQDLAPFHEGFCRELIGRAIPLSRSSLGLELLHPEQSGQQSVWSNEMHATIRPAYHGVELTSDYLLSPARIVDETNRPFRRRLDAPAGDMPLLEDLRLNGATDYAIFPLPFQDRTRSAFLSFATAEPAGFSNDDVQALAAACRLFSPYAERRALRRIAVDLLDTYVGRHAGERVFQGSILRGEVETISCAILMCDMRGFTVLSNRLDRSAMIDILNRSFEAIEGPVEAQGGEILKFIGDGLLAIFRADQDMGDSCRRALTAAIEAQAALSRLEGGLASEPPASFAMGLHIGEVAYGNVGGRRRLDFTVLGPAVNYASRLQDLAKRLDAPVLISRAFAGSDPGRFRDIGPHPLRGISDAEQIFALAS